MFLINKLVSWIVSPWRKKNGKSKENDAEKGNKGTAETEERNVKVNTTNNIGGSDKKETKKGWKYWLVIILLIVLIANVAALHVKVNNLSKLKPSNPQIQNPNDTDIEQKFRSIACVTMYGSQSTVLKDFPCVECLDFGQEFYNVTEFCILRSFWRNALNRTTFEQLRWLSDNNYCNWGGVTCNENKNVVELTFRAPFVPFAFTANLAKMTTLRKITILGNGAFPIGELPDVFFQLSNLEELSIVSTGYNGPIPSKVKPSGNVNLNLLVSLKKLELFNNTQLNGTIPDEFSNLKELKELNLTDNKFSGPIPNSIGTIDINRLALSGNLLTGTVPDNICQRNYVDGGCDLGRNQLTTQSCGKCNLT